MKRGFGLARSLSILLAVGCASEDEPIALADQPKGIQAPAPDLDALAAMREASGGSAFEEQAQQARSEGAQRAYVNKEGEPSLADVVEAGRDPVQEVDVAAGSTAGSGAPSDLDTLDDEPDAPWINMEVVEQKIRSRDRSMKSCWDTHGPGGPGRVEMKLTIGAGGRASSVKLGPDSPVRNGDVAGCLAKTLKNIKYPEPRHGSVTFIYPVKF